MKIEDRRYLALLLRFKHFEIKNERFQTSVRNATNTEITIDDFTMLIFTIQNKPSP